MATILESTLKAGGFSTTRPRRLVYETLSTHGALTIGTLCDYTQALVDRSSVYRTIELFEKLGIVRRMHLGWKFTIELSDAFSHHHHHAVCSSCGVIFEFEESAQLVTDIERLAAGLGMTLQSHNLELRGACAQCMQTVC